MVINKNWGYYYWNFFHIFVCKLDENKLTNVNNLNIIKKIIYSLINSISCNVCKNDCLNYFKIKNFNSINKKEQLINFFFLFHNHVNKKIRKPIQHKNILETYKNLNCIQFLKMIDIKIYKNRMNKNYYKFVNYITS